MTEGKKPGFDYFAWRDRMRAYAEDRTPLHVKVLFARNLARTQAPNASEDAIDAFLDPEFQPNSGDIERSLKYAAVEREIGRMFDGSLASEDRKEYNRRIQTHHDGILPILNEHFTQDEIRDFCMGKLPGKRMVLDPTFTLARVGSNSIWGRRIRNAYLPGITTVLSIDQERGTAEDVMPRLFDGQMDAADTIDRLLGKDRT